MLNSDKFQDSAHILFGDLHNHQTPYEKHEQRCDRLIRALLAGKNLMGKSPSSGARSPYKSNNAGLEGRKYPIVSIDYDLELMECTLKNTTFSSVRYIKPGEPMHHLKRRLSHIVDFARVYLRADSKDSPDITVKKNQMIELLQKHGYKI